MAAFLTSFPCSFIRDFGTSKKRSVRKGLPLEDHNIIIFSKPKPQIANLQFFSLASSINGPPFKHRSIARHGENVHVLDDESTGITVLKRRRLLSLALPISFGFLPWRGCSEGGFYDTRLVGENCQKVYQPAAGAEERLRQRMARESGEAQHQQESTLGIHEKPNSRVYGIKGESDGDFGRLRSQERALMDVQRQRNTRALVDSMWQSLE